MIINFVQTFFSEHNTRTWVIGDSIVKCAGESNVHLNGGGQTQWRGFPGVQSDGLAN